MSRKQQVPDHSSSDEKPIERSFFLRNRILVVALLALLACGGLVFADWWICLPEGAHATFVGTQACVECHKEYYDQWKGSHHDLAMDRATPETMLGDFNDVRFEQFGIKSRLFRQDDKYMVHTEGPDGEMADFEVKYVFGVTPLQQYMVEFDRLQDMPACEVARLQVLRLSWDTEREEWFYLRPRDVDEKLAHHDLHWTGIAQRWNNMCADCHSTNLQKNYDVKTKTYHTTFSEINVGCEMCHGPSSLHVELANSKSLFWDRKQGYGLVKLKDDAKTQIHTCAPCHSRRRVVHPGFQPGDDYYDYFANELLGRETYHADGQILDEVYVYASFIQSKMYHKEIRCTDCHNPHTVRLKHDGNKVCTSCHQHPEGKYDSPAHHHHQPGSTGASCAECHMPETTYMAVDPRRDHSIRNPRPDLSVALGTPNACTRCHLEIEKEEGKVNLNDRDDLNQYLDWVLAARNGDQEVKKVLSRIDAEMQKSCDEWYGDKLREPSRKKHFAFTLDAARRGEPGAEQELVDVIGDGRIPGIVRATALQELGTYGTRLNTSVSMRCLDDSDPQVQVAAIGNLQGRLADDRLIMSLVPLLTDPLRVVRTEAARVLATVPTSEMRGAQRRQLKDALAEFEKGMMLSNDRAAAHMTMGILHESLGEDDQALERYETAIDIEPTVTGPRTNLAALCDRLAEAADRKAQQAALLRNRESGSEAVRKAADYRDRAAKLRRKELDWLERDAKLVPNSASVQYRYGMSLYLHRRLKEAEEALVSASELEPNNPQFLLGVVLFYKELNQPDKAIPLAERLVALRPQDAMFRQILEETRRGQ